MIKKLFNTLFDNLLILQFNLYERMMYMGNVTTENGTKIEVQNLAVTYANVIMWGIKSFNKAPKRLKSDIALILYVNGCEDLITDKTYVEEAKERVEEAEANMQ